MSDPRPGYTVARCCKNCHFYRFTTKAYGVNREATTGKCLLPKVIDKNEKPLPTHFTAYCDAHIWRSKGVTVQKIVVKFGASPPEGTY